MTDTSSYRGVVLPASKPVDPPGGSGDDPLSELARLIGHYEASGAIVRPNGRRQELGARRTLSRTMDSTSLQGRQDQPHREWESERGQPAQGLYAQVATPLAGSTSPPEAAGNVEDSWADDEYASDEPQPDGGEAYWSRVPKRRRGLRLVVAIIGLVLVGSAGTAAYRLWFAGGKSNGAALMAEVGSKKSAPGAGGSTSSKPIDGRVNGQGSDNEPVVPRNARAPFTPVFPLAGSAAPASTGPSEASPSAEGALVDARKALSEKLLTPQGSNVDSWPTGSLPAVASDPIAKPDTASPAPQTLAARSAADPSQTPTPRAAPAGGYVVQLSSQRSEAAAQATSRTLQTKYASLFGGRQPFIRRSDLGERGGVYYRTQVGPFAGFTEAKEFCGSLKKAGGADCVVLKN